MRTRLTDALQIEHPVMLAGMGGVSYHTLVAAVSEAGGFGCARRVGDDARSDGRGDSCRPRGDRQAVRCRPAHCTARPAPRQHRVADRGGRVGLRRGPWRPRDVITLCHERNVLVVNMCGRVRHAIAAVEAGCDIVVAQGTEAGGHTGTVATMPLVPQVVDAVGDRVPVVAAGGLFDGRGLAASLALGADGVWIGTRFIATPEARAVPGYKEALIATPEDGTVISRAFTGKTLPRRAEPGDPVLRGAPRRAQALPRADLCRDVGRQDAPRRRRIDRGCRP